MSRYGSGLIGTAACVGDFEVCWYCNRYGHHFTDTNNLSVATFIRFGSFSILFAGDLEADGWESLLRLPSFRDRLATVRVLVASHHGRKNGQCEEVFNIVRPEFVIFSDDAIQHDTQKTDAWYRNRVLGIPDLFASPRGLGLPKRHVLTTRRDGTIRLQITPEGFCWVTPHFQQPINPYLGFGGLIGGHAA